MPFSADGQIVVGKIETDNVVTEAYVISGMASEGMSMGVGAAKLLVEMICGCPRAKEILKPADPNRFVIEHSERL